jgi:uncharacterized protein YjbI with pentapeptide repeats
MSMRAVSAVVHRLLGTLHPEWDLRLGQAGPGRRRKGATGVLLEEETRSGAIAGGVPVELAIRCRYDGATLTAPVLVGRCELTSFRGADLREPRLGPNARIIGCDLTGATCTGGGGADAALVACSLRESRLSDMELGTLHLCDLSYAYLDRVQIERAVACDFSGAQLIDCGFEGADLRSSCFRGAVFRGGSLRGARVDGADFSGAQGLDKATRQRLMKAGARFHGARLAKLLHRLSPAVDPIKLHRVGAVGTALAWVLGSTLVGGGVWIAFHPPALVATTVTTPVRDRAPTVEERNRTRIALQDARSGLTTAHETMLSNGAKNRSWPTMVEFQNNRFDLDGDGPGEVMQRLFPGGIPANYLTDSERGVLPYCNEEPDQATLSGVDTDWHYCEQTGRIFAGAGFSGQATLNW